MDLSLRQSGTNATLNEAWTNISPILVPLHPQLRLPGKEVFFKSVQHRLRPNSHKSSIRAEAISQTVAGGAKLAQWTERNGLQLENSATKSAPNAHTSASLAKYLTASTCKDVQ